MELRLSEIADSLQNMGVFQQFAGMASIVHNGRVACELLHLGSHPATLEHRRHKKDHIHWQVMYHADTYTKYKMVLPELSYQPKVQRSLDSFLPIDSPNESVRRVPFAQSVTAKLREARPSSFFSTNIDDATFLSLRSLLMPVKMRDSPSVALEVEPQEDLRPLALQDFPARSMPLSLDSSLSQTAHKLIFFQIMDPHLAHAKRTAVAGQHSLSRCITITLHTPLLLAQADGTACVSLQPLMLPSQPEALVVNPCSFSVHGLRHMCAWKCKSEMSYFVPLLHTLPQHLLADALKVLEVIATSPLGVLENAIPDIANWVPVIELFVAEGLVSGPPWRLTASGQEPLKNKKNAPSPFTNGFIDFIPLKVPPTFNFLCALTPPKSHPPPTQRFTLCSQMRRH